MTDEVKRTDDVSASTGAPAGAGEVPKVRFSEKKVDQSWKEEARREKEAAAKAAAAGVARPTSSTQAAAPRPEAVGGAEASAATTATGEAGAAGAAGAGKGEDSSGEQETSRLFISLIAGLVQQALMQLGAMESPFTGRRELDPEGARSSIDLLVVLRDKTRGNLSAKESHALEDALHELQLRYVETVNEMQRSAAEQAVSNSPVGNQPLRNDGTPR